MEVARRRGRRRKKLLDDLKDRRGYSHLKEEALHRTMWRHRFGGGFGPVVRQNTEWMNENVWRFWVANIKSSLFRLWHLGEREYNSIHFKLGIEKVLLVTFMDQSHYYQVNDHR